jgi:hypothetical protein
MLEDITPRRFSMATKGKGDEGGFSGDDNVHKGSGSKGGSEAGRSKGPPVTASPGGSARPTDGAEKSREATFAEGGNTKMFGEQQAGGRTDGDKSPSTGKPDDRGPGEKFAEGGKGKMFGFAGALPATAGISAARES